VAEAAKLPEPLRKILSFGLALGPRKWVKLFFSLFSFSSLFLSFFGWGGGKLWSAEGGWERVAGRSDYNSGMTREYKLVC
jgi:hypothetical protein